jgi:hypothetical protein
VQRATTRAPIAAVTSSGGRRCESVLDASSASHPTGSALPSGCVVRHIDQPAVGRGLEFNLSSSGDLAAFGCAVGRDIGIDMERVCVHADLLAVADNCFPAYERATPGALPHASRARAFYRCWTRKEAYLKAIGSGLDSTLQDLDLPVVCIKTLVMERRLGMPAKPHTIAREI